MRERARKQRERTKSLDRRDKQIISEQLANLGCAARATRESALESTDEDVAHRRADEEAVGGDLHCAEVDLVFIHFLVDRWTMFKRKNRKGGMT